MNPYLRFFLVLFLLATTWLTPVGAGELPDSALAPLRELMELSGMKKMVESIPALVSAEFVQAQQDKKQLPDDKVKYQQSCSGSSFLTGVIRKNIEEFLRVVAKAEIPGNVLDQLQKSASSSFSAGAMLKEMEDFFRKTLTEELIHLLLEWYKSPLAKKIIKAESESLLPAKFPEMKTFMADLEKNPLPASRLKLIARLDKATDGIEFYLDMMIVTQFNMMKTMNQMLPAEQQLNPDSFGLARVKAGEKFRTSFKQQILGTWGYVYKDLTDAELEEYIKFCDSSAGPYWGATMKDALILGMEKPSLDFGTQLMKVVR